MVKPKYKELYINEKIEKEKYKNILNCVLNGLKNFNDINVEEEKDFLNKKIYIVQNKTNNYIDISYLDIDKECIK